MAMFQLPAAMACAVARPMPRLEPAPVMMAVLSDTGMIPPNGVYGRESTSQAAGANPCSKDVI